jgi:hypothetical protein
MISAWELHPGSPAASCPLFRNPPPVPSRASLQVTCQATSRAAAKPGLRPIFVNEFAGLIGYTSRGFSLST